MNQRKKKAFTLTELLVVVVIIGVLAAVVLPKFNKVIETRKTTEAEEVMAAVRTEQERRCALEKPYIGNIEKLVTNQVLPQTDTKNYTYSLESTGMLARSKGMSYKLKMPSYADGRVCCEGADCGKLNKDYPTCNDLVQQADYQQATACTAEIPSVPEPEPEPVYYSCNIDTKPPLTQSCNTCGEQSRTVNCDTTTGTWVPGAWGACSKSETECNSCEFLRNNQQDKNLEYLRCVDPDYYYYEGTWNDTTCMCDCPEGTKLASDGTCQPTCNNPEGKDRCEGPSSTGHYGTWNASTCSCDCPEGTKLASDGTCWRDCGNRNHSDRCWGDGNTRGNWDWNECSCTCPSGSFETVGGGCNTSTCFYDGTQDTDEWGRLIYWCTTASNGNTAGTWDYVACGCRCPRGTYVLKYRDPRGSGCYGDAPRDFDGCDNFNSDCIVQDSEDFGYDPYDDGGRDDGPDYDPPDWDY